MFGLNGALNVFVVIIFTIIIIALILGLIWLLVPYFFRWFVAPHFDGSYEPRKDPLSSSTKAIDLSLQAENPKIKIDNEKAEYSITFGESRSLSNGNVKIHVNGKWYAAHQDADEELLIFNGAETTEVETPLGPAQKTIWNWQIPETNFEFSTSFIVKERSNYLIFEVASENGIKNTANGDFNTPILNFPVFQNESPNKRIFTYRDGIFCPPMRDFTYTTAPVLFFDDNKNSFLCSALDNFITNGIKKKELSSGTREIECGPNGEVANIPSNHKHQYILVFHHGINATFQNWGELLHKYYDQPYKDRYMDAMTAKLGYFTDNGAYYYYNPLPGMKYDGTLIAVKEYADRESIPFEYYHLDSWWYQKSVEKWKRSLLGGFGRIVGGGLYGGTLLWEIDSQALDMSLDELYQKLDQKTFTAHNRWYSVKSPYIDKFNFIIEDNKAMPDDPTFWEHIMKFCKENHIEVYEQDWMKNQITAFTFLRSEIGAAERWLRDMAVAAANNDISIQYCMATPAMWMESLKYPAVSNCRACGDYAPRWPHVYDIPYFMQSSMLASAVGLIPFKDTFESTRKGRINGERCPELMGLVSCLSAGPVAPGDEIDFVNKAIVNASCRKDGLLYKPDCPMTAVDLTYIKNQTYYICSTYSQKEQFRWYYTLTMNLWPKRVKDHVYSLHDIDIEGNYIEYDWFSHQIQKISQDSSIEQHLKEEQYKYRIYAPLLLNGMAILGDPTKYLMMNDIEFPKIEETKKGVSIFIENIAGEKTELLVYCETLPAEISLNGEQLGPQADAESYYQYDDGKKLLHIYINFRENAQKILNILSRS